MEKANLVFGLLVFRPGARRRVNRTEDPEPGGGGESRIKVTG